MSDATVPVKRKPGRPRKNPVVENTDAQAQASVGGQAAERSDQEARESAVVCNSGELDQVSLEAGVCDLPAASRLSPSELAAIHREAWEAFDYDAPRGKTDSIGRIWAFDPDIKGGQKVVELSVRRVGQARYCTQITVPAIGYQDARPVVEQIVNRLNEEVR